MIGDWLFCFLKKKKKMIVDPHFCLKRFYMALTHCASSGTGSAAFGWIYCPHNETKNTNGFFLYPFKSFKCMTSGLLQNSAEPQRRVFGTWPGFHAQQKRGGFDPTNHHKVASTLGRESSIPPSLPLNVFWKTSRCTSLIIFVILVFH